MTDKISERSKGFGFVTFASDDEAENAITGMNGKVMTISVYLNALSIPGCILDMRTNGCIS